MECTMVFSKHSNHEGSSVSVGIKVGVYFSLAKTREIKIADELPVITEAAKPVQKTDAVIAPQKVEDVAAVATEPSILHLLLLL